MVKAKQVPATDPQARLVHCVRCNDVLYVGPAQLAEAELACARCMLVTAVHKVANKLGMRVGL